MANALLRFCRITDERFSSPRLAAGSIFKSHGTMCMAIRSGNSCLLLLLLLLLLARLAAAPLYDLSM